MGFARTATQSTLGQPLNFIASISLESDETVTRDCVSAEVYAGDAKIPAPNVYVSLGPLRDASQRDVRISTATAIDEPVVTIELSIGCTSKMSRRFVAFIDPPSLQLADTRPLDADGADSPRIASQTAALAELARRADLSRGVASGGDASRSDSTRGRRASHAARSQRTAMRNAPRRAAATSRVASNTRRGSRGALASNHGGAHLQLEAPRMVLAPVLSASAASMPSAAAPMVAVASDAAASSVAGAAPIDLAPVPAPVVVAGVASNAVQSERDRMLMLETGLANLRDESLATKKTIGALQARLRDAEGARYSNGLVYALAGIALFLGLVTAGLLWLRPRQRRQARWFEAEANREARSMRSAEREAAAAAEFLPTAKPLSATALADVRQQGIDHPPGMLSVTAPATIGGLEVTTVLGPQLTRPLAALLPAAGLDDGVKKSGDLSMEELIDLEQQAEFFVVLGQDEASISLLDNYMRSDGGKSPLPYLQLLEIHQRRGDQPAYEIVRQAFNSRFQANAPEWSSDIHFGRALVDYPQTIARLQSLWATPLSAMQALDGLLFRRHSVEDTFDFPAYRELLFLYSIARELSGQVETDFGSIDLFLPLEDATPAGSTSTSASATTMSGGLELAVDLDVSAWPAGATANELQVRRSAGGR